PTPHPQKKMHRSALASVCLCLLHTVAQAEVTEIYSTNFNDFPIGADTIHGNDGWAANNRGDGVHGTGEFIQGLGTSVFLGGVRPATTATTVAWTIDTSDKIANEVIEFEMIIGVQDSDNLFRDTFGITLFNQSGNFLASIRFDNSDQEFAIIRRSNGDTVVDTGDTFLRNEIMLLELSVNLQNNTWTAFLDDLPIFEDALLNDTNQLLNFGSIAAQWLLTSSSPAAFGTNWLLVDELDIFVTTENPPPVGIEPFVVDSLALESGSPTLTWFGQAGFTYQVEFSSDLITWSSTLPDSSKTPGAADAPLTYTDTTTSETTRFYRVARTLTN
ncbi:MAG: hypothetical protein P8J87_11725, partial [Verrucomicrobiales bacterium]|nr:hypothetical protein [Verrucomicrobiales bacterium]